MSENFRKIPCMRGGVAQVYPNVRKNTPIFANSVIAGNLVFVSGQTALDDETGFCIDTTIQGQMETVMTHLKQALEEAGSSLEYMIKNTIILSDIKNYFAMRAAEQDFYRRHAPSLLENPPASTVFQAAAMARPEFLVEIEAVGYIKEK
ncbi:MAG: RidA family protein [Oscillospiraceae bacterium]|jgi:2-iminobutanoate/2-iminopropanoate deaminase